MVTITNLGHACFKIENDDFSFIVDPYDDGSVPGLRLPDHISANAVFCSHDHRDHNAAHLVECYPKDYPLKVEEVMLPHDHENGAKRGRVCARIFYFDGLKIVHLSDLGDVSDMSLFAPFLNSDIVFVPINGFFTINAKEAKIFDEHVKPRVIIPMHYEKLDPPSGYPDGGQIYEFMHFFPDYLKVNTQAVTMSPAMWEYHALIFN